MAQQNYSNQDSPSTDNASLSGAQQSTFDSVIAMGFSSERCANVRWCQLKVGYIVDAKDDQHK